MSNNTKQTAVDFLYSIMFEKQGRITKEEYDKAKEMEKEQHEETWIDSKVLNIGYSYIGKTISFEEYYIRIYGGNK